MDSRIEEILHKKLGDAYQDVPLMSRIEVLLDRLDSGGGGDEDIHEYTLTAEEMSPEWDSEQLPLTSWLTINKNLYQDLQQRKTIRLIGYAPLENEMTVKRSLIISPTWESDKLGYGMMYVALFGYGEDTVEETEDLYSLGYFEGIALLIPDEYAEEIGLESGALMIGVSFLCMSLNILGGFNCVPRINYGSGVWFYRNGTRKDSESVGIFSNYMNAQGLRIFLKYSRNGVTSEQYFSFIPRADTRVDFQRDNNYYAYTYEQLSSGDRMCYTSSLIQSEPEDNKFVLITVGTLCGPLNDDDYNPKYDNGIKIRITTCNLLNPSDASTIDIQAVYHISNSNEDTTGFTELIVNGNDALIDKNNTQYISNAINNCLFSQLPSSVSSINIGTLSMNISTETYTDPIIN